MASPHRASAILVVLCEDSRHARHQVPEPRRNVVIIKVDRSRSHSRPPRAAPLYPDMRRRRSSGSSSNNNINKNRGVENRPDKNGRAFVSNQNGRQPSDNNGSTGMAAERDPARSVTRVRPGATHRARHGPVSLDSCPPPRPSCLRMAPRRRSALPPWCRCHRAGPAWREQILQRLHGRPLGRPHPGARTET